MEKLKIYCSLWIKIRSHKIKMMKPEKPPLVPRYIPEPVAECIPLSGCLGASVVTQMGEIKDVWGQWRGAGDFSYCWARTTQSWWDYTHYTPRIIDFYHRTDACKVEHSCQTLWDPTDPSLFIA